MQSFDENNTSVIIPHLEEKQRTRDLVFLLSELTALDMLCFEPPGVFCIRSSFEIQ